MVICRTMPLARSLTVVPLIRVVQAALCLQEAGRVLFVAYILYATVYFHTRLISNCMNRLSPCLGELSHEQFHRHFAPHFHMYRDIVLVTDEDEI